VVYPVLEFREKKQTFAKIRRGNMEFFLAVMLTLAVAPLAQQN
jgi:hypothetical protein